jgi:hypothetical protein
MASKRTLNVGNLEALGAVALAALLIEVSSGNAVIQRRLRLALAAAVGPDGAAQEVRKRLAAIARATTVVDSRKRKALLADLEAQHQAITGPIAAAEPAQAFQLLVRFLELADGVFQRALADLGGLATAAALPAETLVEQASELIATNGYGQFDQLIPCLAPALGEQGLTQLQRLIEEHGGVDAPCVLRQIAEALGDVEAYLAQFNPSQLAMPGVAAAVALHLLGAGRPQQALTILDGATLAAATWPQAHWHDARIAVLDGLDRVDEAQQQRWQCFSERLSIPHLRAYLKRLPDFEDLGEEERALQLAEHHPQPLRALAFLVEWPALSRAARLVIRHGPHWDGEAYGVLAPAAERLGHDHPLAATILLRAMVVFALSCGLSKRYRYAAAHLHTCERLAARIDHWQEMESAATFVGRLREAFGRTWSFWQLVER